MKKRLLLTALVLAACAAAPAHADSRVRTLGVTQLGHREGDLRMLDVQCRPRVSAIKLRATRGTADIDRVFVTYGNGDRDSLPVRQYLDRGRETRWIDLVGRKRCVTEIGIVGDSERGWREAMREETGRDGRDGRHGRRGGRGGRAEVEVLGRF
ncbi:MAG TPA: hypothetical protein VFL14_08145 [Xanthomonadales bacterium]|nr:hypothetical protein [Xanthomonadales bacterium]